MYDVLTDKDIGYRILICQLQEVFLNLATIVPDI